MTALRHSQTCCNPGGWPTVVPIFYAKDQSFGHREDDGIWRIALHGVLGIPFDTTDVIRAMPKIRVPIKRSSEIGEPVAPPSRTRGFEGLDQGRDVERRMEAHQKRNRVGLPTKFELDAAPIGQNL